MEIDEINKIKEQLSKVEAMALELFNGNKEDADAWMKDPNEFLFGWTPGQLIISGEGQVLIDWLLVRMNKKPGSAF
jgi:uncharacterized protein (DUF2384 family)